MYNPHSLFAEQIARDQREAALSSARRERLLRESQPRPSSAWAQFNHYHYWPDSGDHASTEAAIEAARVERMLRRQPGALQRLFTAVTRLFDRPAAA